MAKTLTSEDFAELRTVIRDEVETVFGSRGRQVMREEAELIFEKRARNIIFEIVDSAFESRGRQIVREELEVAMTRFSNRLTATENDVHELYDITSKQGREMRQQARRANKRLSRLEGNAGLPAMKF